jgi:glycosyltransferase involved in cell wall biosynthesis
MKVLFLVSTLERSGPTNVIFNIIKYLNRQIVEPIILTLSPETSNTRIEDFDRLRVKIFSYHKSRLHWILSDMRDLLELMETISPDVIHSHSLRPDITSAKHFNNYIRICTIHGDLRTNYSDTYGTLIGSYFAKRQLHSIFKLDYAVACADSIFFLYNGAIRNITSIKNGVDEDTFFPLAKEQVIEYRNRLKLPLDKKIVVTAGSLSKRKDPATVIQGFLSSKFCQESILLIIGTGPLMQELQGRYSTKKNIIFVGFTNNVAPYMQCADIFVSASISEGLPNSVMEALGCGLPVCLSDIPAHQEILSKHKEAGKFFDCHNPMKLTIALDSVLNENYDSIRKHAIRIVKEELNAKHMALSYQNLYTTLSEKFGRPVKA